LVCIFGAKKAQQRKLGKNSFRVQHGSRFDIAAPQF
jgi:hypothetical protein